MSTSKARALAPKQQRFVDEYLCDLNATQAAIRGQKLRRLVPGADDLRATYPLLRNLQFVSSGAIVRAAAIHLERRAQDALGLA